MSESTLVGNEKLKEQYKEVVSKVKKLVNVKKLETDISNAASEVIQTTSHAASPVAEDINSFLSKIATKDAVKKLKRELEGWREIILQLNSVLLWEKSWYPGVIAGISTFVFILLWLLDPSLLSTVSSIALFATLLDYLVPTVMASLYSPAHWTGAMEKKYEDICKALVHNYNIASHQVTAFMDLKTTSPKLYYSVTITSLVLLAYVGNSINNLVLTYIFVTILMLTPGLVHHGIIYKYYQLMLQNVANILKSLNGSKGADKLKVN